MKTSFLKFLLVSSVVLPNPGMASEDIVFSDNDLHIRTLAASCSACHGTQGNAVGSNGVMDVPGLAGVDKSHIVQRLLDFRTGVRTSTVMHRHARGVTLEEINQLADFFSRQMPVKHYPPQSQTLKVGS